MVLLEFMTSSSKFFVQYVVVAVVYSIQWTVVAAWKFTGSVDGAASELGANTFYASPWFNPLLCT